jgi:hypothetical protein
MNAKTPDFNRTFVIGAVVDAATDCPCAIKTNNSDE